MTGSHQTPELPKGWAWTKLEEIATEINSGFPSGRWKRGAENGIPHLRPMNIDAKGRINLADVKYVQAEGYDALSKGDVMFNNTNSPELLGKTAYIREDTNWAYSNHMTRIRFVPSLTEPAFISHYLHFLFLNGYFKMSCVHHVNQASIGKDFLSKMRIPFPPNSEQKRVVTKLEELFARLDAGVEGLRKVKAQLKRYRQVVLKYAFEGKLTEGWRKAHKDRIEHAPVLLEKIEKKRISRNPQWKSAEPINPKDLPEIPDDWIWVRAQEVCENITNGYTPSASELHASKGEVPFIKINNLTFTGKLDFSKNKTFIDTKVHETLLKRSKVFPGDVLINIVGPPLGKVSIVPNLYPEWNINQAIVFFRPIEGYDRDFLALCLQTRTITSHLTNQAKATAGQFNISVNMSRNLPIPLPSQEEQKEIVLEVMKHLGAMESAEIALCNSLSKADYLRNSMLKSAFLGKLVPQDQNDEPAEKLLERIRVERIKRHSERSVSSSHRKLEIDNQVELSRYVK